MSDAYSELLDRFFAAWYRKDLDGLLDCVTDDIVFLMSTGPEPGLTLRGKADVGKAFAEQMADDGTATTVLDEPVVLGEHAYGTWSVESPDMAVPVRGVDLYTFRDGLIAIKDVYRKISPA
jgi:ketosteroid isomerase-like protein